jgi:hypothetical protein
VKTLMLKIYSGIKVIGVDVVYVGTMDAIAVRRIKLTKDDSGWVPTRDTRTTSTKVSSRVKGNGVRLSANAAVGVCFEEEYCREGSRRGRSSPDPTGGVADRDRPVYLPDA